eukprot:6860166-Prymnesium_polylepis.1
MRALARSGGGRLASSALRSVISSTSGLSWAAARAARSFSCRSTSIAAAFSRRHFARPSRPPCSASSRACATVV